VPTTTEPQGAQRFTEIEGLRAWLAWTVVFAHLFIVLSFYAYGAAYLAPLFGTYAVQVFILISGFVITHLIEQRRESYTPYITRRAFRIFPAYLIALAAGAVATPLAIAGLSHVAWGSDPNSYFFDSLQGRFASTEAHPWAHWLLHLTLFQGAVPDNVLPWSSIAFLAPAWSLSLEWQFYLIAPLLVWSLKTPRWRFVVAAAAIALALLFSRGVFGSYSTPSSLLGGLWLFVIGAVTRLAFPFLRTVAFPALPIAVALVVAGFLSSGLLPVTLWLAFALLLARPGPLSAWPMRIAFASAPAQYFGARSYSVYVVHMPIMKALLFILPLGAMTHVQALGALAACALPLTAMTSEILYRCVERPMIGAGARIAKSLPSRTFPAATVAAGQGDRAS
jgi:peptidoglycan/LPS O-acetylase OafA/YrhL